MNRLGVMARWGWMAALLAPLGCGSDDGSQSGGDCSAPSGCLEQCICDTGNADACAMACSTGSGGAGAGGSGGSSGSATGGASGSGVGGSSGAGGSGTGGAGGSGMAGGTTPQGQFIPTPTGQCPDFVGEEITVSPAGIPPRNVRIWIGPAAADLDGPLVFYWHGTGSSPVIEPPAGLGGGIDDILAMGGIVTAPFHDPAAGTFPWFYTAPPADRDDDFRVADEILACAIEKVGVDLSRIHSIGMSAGGLQTTQMSYLRSGYIASSVTYSGGLLGAATPQDPANRFASMIYHGGPSDRVVISFQDFSNAYYDDLKSKGHFTFICDHGMGHTIPFAYNTQSWEFMKAHPFGTQPSPYASGLPAGFPPYCTL